MAEAQSSLSSLNAKIDEAYRIREEKRELNAQIRALDKRLGELEAEVIDELTAAGTYKFGTALVSASLSSEEKPSIFDWELFTGYVHERGATHLLIRQVNQAAWRDERTVFGGEIPGVGAFTKYKLSLTKTKG